MPVAAGLIIAIGDTTLRFTDTFSLSGIALGTIVVIVMYHLCRAIAPKDTDTEPARPAVVPPQPDTEPDDGARVPAPSV